MTLIKNSSVNPDSNNAAEAVVEVWREAMAVLETDRLQRLQSLSEQDAARQFTQLLQLPGPYPLRPTSGLVEQQRLLERLRSRK